MKQFRLYLPVLLSPVYPSVQTPTVSVGVALKLLFLQEKVVASISNDIKQREVGYWGKQIFELLSSQ
ncbi:MAG: hypothetical protein ACK52X_00955 [bacterium]